MRAPVSAVAATAALILLAWLGPAHAATAPRPGPFDGCPEQGRGGHMALNRLKNRSAPVPAPQATTVAELNALPASGRHVGGLEAGGVVVEGFLVDAKLMGRESCNCGRPDLRDYHLWIADRSGEWKDRAVVAEVTPRWRAANAGWRLDTLRRLGRANARIRLTGWRMLDPEHPDQIGRTRGSLWEIHPITKIEVWNGGRWVEL